MRAVLSIILLLGLSASLLLADLEPSAKAVLAPVSNLVDVSVATSPGLAVPEDMVMRSIAMGLGIIFLGLSGYLAFGRKPRPLPAQDDVSRE